MEETDEDVTIEDMALRGSKLLEFKNKEIKKYVNKAIPAKLSIKNTITNSVDNYKILIVGCPDDYRSDVGNIISSSQKCDFVALYFHDFKRNAFIISFRGSKDCKYDLSEIAKQLGGGGHKLASGCSVKNLNQYFTLDDNLSSSSISSI